MRFILIGLSIVLFLIGLAYLYQPNIIISFNNLMRKVFFNDTKILVRRKKISIVYIALSIIIFYVGLFHIQLHQDKKFSREMKLYQVWNWYHRGKFDVAEKLCLELYRDDPKDLTVLKQLAYIYFVKQDYRKAKVFAEKFLAISPENKKLKNILNESIEKLNLLSFSTEKRK